jgi:homoaconitase/3-isopropylmalate dehydratase large subunit
MHMGRTIAEKILARAGGKREITPGEYVFLTSPCPVPGIGRGKEYFDEHVKLFDPEMAIVMDDHMGASGWNAFDTENRRAAMWKWAGELGIPRSNIFINKGIGHVISGERCWPLPGTVYLSITNGHSTTLGGLGAIALTLSLEAMAYMVLGRTWLRVPESIRFNLTGKLQNGVMARDISDFVLGEIGPAGATYKVIEWTGPVIDDMSMDGRFSICNDALHSGAKTSIVNPDQKTIDYARARTQASFEPLVSDPDAAYAKIYEYDLSDLEPQVVEPPKRWTVKPVTAFTDIVLNRAFIGTCFNSRMEDMRIAARILKNRQIHPNVRLNITPGSNEVLKQATREGLIETFIDAGCEIPMPSCGMCGGFSTPLAAGDVCIATGTCNYPGRMGDHDSEIYLANPATVAASAIAGRITDPRSYI